MGGSYLGNIYNSFNSGDNYMKPFADNTLITEGKVTEKFMDTPNVFMLIGLILLTLIVIFIIVSYFKKPSKHLKN